MKLLICINQTEQPFLEPKVTLAEPDLPQNNAAAQYQNESFDPSYEVSIV